MLLLRNMRVYFPSLLPVFHPEHIQQQNDPPYIIVLFIRISSSAGISVGIPQAILVPSCIARLISTLHAVFGLLTPPPVEPLCGISSAKVSRLPQAHHLRQSGH